MTIRRISTGSPWEAKMGYSRAVVAGGMVFISATAATDASGAVVGIGDFERQTAVILEKLGAVLAEAGSGIDRVVQSRVYLTDVDQWEAVGRAHGVVFGTNGPALSLVHVKPFLDPDMLVEVELVAVV
ncbi:Rid family hydrolase [Novosphingobium sp.]|uniref:Rid family hydrolase n=1 Tax=Novosphingobium sp. TaxID=1874826 RepID=UPI003D0F3F60